MQILKRHFFEDASVLGHDAIEFRAAIAHDLSSLTRRRNNAEGLGRRLGVLKRSQPELGVDFALVPVVEEGEEEDKSDEADDGESYDH